MNCDSLASAYRWLEYASFGRALARCRMEFLPAVAGARRVLMLGDGDGRFLAAFLRGNPQAEVDSVDSSARMLAVASHRAGAAAEDQVRFHHADAAIWQPPAGARYDLIVTHFFLDCFAEAELAVLIPKLAAASAPGAQWLLSEFRQPGHGVAAWRARIWLRLLYAAFGFLTGLAVRRLPDYARFLRVHGFSLERVVIREGGMLTSELWRRSP